MNRRILFLCALAAIALLASGAPVFRDTHQQASASPARVFDAILAQGYPGWTGFRTCRPTTFAQHVLCWAELHRGNVYRQVEIDLDLSSPNPIPHEMAHIEPWTRAPMHIAAPEGHGTANTREYGWQLVMQKVPALHLPADFFAVEDAHLSYPAAMFLFHCTGAPTRITCKNSLGDYLTFTPN